MTESQTEYGGAGYCFDNYDNGKKTLPKFARNNTANHLDTISRKSQPRMSGSISMPKLKQGVAVNQM